MRGVEAKRKQRNKPFFRQIASHFGHSQRRSKPKFMQRGGHIYILTNKNHTVLYTGVTSNLANRLFEHRSGKYPKSFTSRYNVTKLVYYEGFTSIKEAILREKQIKAGSRQKKLNLINGFNPDWIDLSSSID